MKFGNMIRGARQGFRYFRKGLYLQVTQIDDNHWKFHFVKHVPIQKSPVEYVCWWDSQIDDYLAASSTLRTLFSYDTLDDDYIFILDESGRDAIGL